MKKFAQILNRKLHWKFEQAEKPEFSSEVHIIEITGLVPDPAEGWLWDGDKFTPPVIKKTDLEKFARLKRDALLSNSDWTQLPDILVSVKSAWAEYRQALRDLPSQEGYPTSIIWPEKPV